MNDSMKKEILAKWNEWKYDLWESNKNNWTQRDDSKVDAITAILEEQLAWQKAADRR